MLSSAVTTKGQVTVPAEMREKFGIKPGDRVGFVEENGRLIIQPHPQGVAAAFGILKAKKSVSLSAMDEAIKAKRKNRAGA
ncbi:MAG TPA: AbrB/MazE/SpoVT family DNA-binding domain-containing protein [Rugosibacter sp.]|jgi:AbrB family looped-hinge helix DNA binding protein|nr:AbrB/MazE/SpoVT family DNA-binding domain-containing protein [Rugosibacter sp.]HPB89885.1 AbrB/MazE/SpoVT family DNA-binding domain-containing protein [Rugosibacter sp.]HQN45572.1 AbrB/MazE/SpoVT family DNA-binding domain-containing protein [Rugosibacter sp.]HQQ34585.1 AbrB/MazE/SpoVT family DNA-binding domain-containing protein [Rugosibacter sp.]